MWNLVSYIHSGLWREYLDLRRDEITGDWESCMQWHSRFILLAKYCQNYRIKIDAIGRECRTHEREEERIQNFYEKRKRKEDAGKINGRILLKWNSKKYVDSVWVGFICLRVVTICGLFRKYQWTFRFHEMVGVSWANFVFPRKFHHRESVYLVSTADESRLFICRIWRQCSKIQPETNFTNSSSDSLNLQYG